MKNKKIILTRGIQGSGKTTWAKQWVMYDSEHRIRFNYDDIRNMLGKYWVTSREDLVKSMRNDFMSHSMGNGYDIIVDNMNLNPDEVKYYKELISNWNKSHYDIQYSMVFKDFFIPVEECIERDSKRAQPIGEQIILDTWKKYSNFIITTENKKFCDSLIPRNENIKNDCIIIDFDSTLCYTTSLDKKETYACKGIIKIINSYNKHIIILSERDDTDENRNYIYNWLIQNKIKPSRILLKGENDTDTESVYKLNMYNKFIKGKYNVDFVIENNKKTIKAYRKAGLLVLEPNEGKF